MDMDLGFPLGGGGMDNNEWDLNNIVNIIQTLPSPNNDNNNNILQTGSHGHPPLSMPEHNHFSVPNVTVTQYDPSYMQFDGNANRSEPYSHLQQALVPMTPNPFVHQYGYIPMKPEPTASSMSKRQLDQMNGYNHLLSTPNFQCQSSIFHEPSTMSTNFTSSQALGTVNQGLPLTWRNEGFTSQVSSSMFPEVTPLLRLERPSRVHQLEQVTSASANELISTGSGKGKLLEYSTTRAKPSKEIQRILNMKPKGRLSLNGTKSSAPPQRSQSLNFPNGRDGLMDNLGNELTKNESDHATPRMLTIGEQQGEYAPRRRGRPRKSNQIFKREKLLEGTRIIGSILSLQETNNTLGNEEESANPTSLFSSLQIPNALYDPKYAREGLPVDPHLRLFKEKMGNYFVP